MLPNHLAHRNFKLNTKVHIEMRIHSNLWTYIIVHVRYMKKIKKIHKCKLGRKKRTTIRLKIFQHASLLILLYTVGSNLSKLKQANKTNKPQTNTRQNSEQLWATGINKDIHMYKPCRYILSMV